VIRWPFWGLILLAVGSLIAFGLGYAVYTAKGQPRNWVTTRNNAHVRSMTASYWTRQRDGRRWFMGRALGETRRSILALAGMQSPWELIEEPVIRNATGTWVLYRWQPGGLISRYHTQHHGLDRENAKALVNGLQAVWGQPQAKAAPFEPLSSVCRVNVWRNTREIHFLELRPQRDGTYTMTIESVASEDPRFRSRWDRGGLPPVHPHVDEVAAQLAQQSPPLNR
jgi:hypothetical protein